jgi:uroporphyrinogen-III synthase
MRALITRPQEDAEALVAELNADGIETFVEPLLNVTALSDAAAKLDRVQAILLTSRNGARALADIMEQRDIPIYAVGDATAGTARELGFLNVESASGDSAALAQLVEDRLDPQDGALLHGSGTAVAGDLAGTLAAKGFTVRCEILYEARPATRLSADLQALLTDGALDVVTFFSPRTAQTFVNLVNSAGLASACRAVTAICISPAVARALGSMAFDHVRVASRPDAPAMVTALNDVRALMELETEHAVADEIEPATKIEAETEAEPETETIIESPVAPEDDQIDNSDSDRDDAVISEPAVTTAARGSVPPSPPKTAKRRGGRAGTWLILIGLVIVGAGFVTYPKWKSHIPAQFRPGGAVVAPAASSADVAALDSRLKQMRAQMTDAISASGKNIKTVEAQLALTEAQLAKMEGQLVAMAKRLIEMEEAAKRSAPAALELTVLNQRIDSLKKQIEDAKSTGPAEQSVATMPPGMENRLQQIEAALKQLAASARTTASPSAAEQALKAENQRLSAALQSLTAQLDAMAGDGAARDSRIAAIEASKARNTGPVTGARGSALVIAVGQLRDALSRSESFAPQLASLKSVAAENAGVTQAVAPLAEYANTGIPTRALLSRRFSAVVTRATRVALVSRDTGWLDRTIAQLSSVVSIRRVGDDVAGDTPQAVLARAEARVQADDLIGALAELAKLTGAPAKSVAGWRQNAEARMTADKAVAALTGMVIHRLATPDGDRP